MRAAQRLAGVLRATARSSVRNFAAEAAPAASQAPEGVGYVAQVCLGCAFAAAEACEDHIAYSKQAEYTTIGTRQLPCFASGDAKQYSSRCQQWSAADEDLVYAGYRSSRGRTV